MSLILQIDTATATCSVALSDKGETIAVKEETGQHIHASHLTLFIEQLLADAGKSVKDLSAVAISKGPGSYTGLRIGVSTAKGLCFALDIPLIATGTLQSMAAGMSTREAVTAQTLLCPMIDARRMEVYTAVFRQDLQELLPVNALIVDQDSFNGFLEENKVLFFGDGAPKCSGLINHPNAHFYDGFFNSAADMSGPAFVRFARQDYENLAYFEPYYLKEFLFKRKSS